MARHQVVHIETGDPQRGAQPAHASNGVGESRSLWLSARESAIYVGCASVDSFYHWRKTRGLVANGRGFYARRDLDTAMAVPRKRHAVSPNSLRNLRRGQPTTTHPHTSAGVRAAKGER